MKEVGDSADNIGLYWEDDVTSLRNMVKVNDLYELNEFRFIVKYKVLLTVIKSQF